jgi:hypothetical protein
MARFDNVDLKPRLDKFIDPYRLFVQEVSEIDVSACEGDPLALLLVINDLVKRANDIRSR